MCDQACRGLQGHVGLQAPLGLQAQRGPQVPHDDDDDDDDDDDLVLERWLPQPSPV